ncbi:MAG: hypothetical protein IT379_31120, partial [Deltaproteobacteria bacterium]|nr:hypothetical protein [Deltaproteobacteria bacterium]
RARSFGSSPPEQGGAEPRPDGATDQHDVPSDATHPFRIRYAPGFLTSGGTIDLHGGLVSGHPVGFAVFTEGFDRGRLRDDVRYVDNEADIQARELEVPERLDTL